MHLATSGSTRSFPHYHLKFAPNHLHHYRAAVVVSKKTTKLAVTRNHLRRRIYSALAATLSPTLSYDLVIYSRPSLTALTPSALTQQLYPLNQLTTLHS